MKATVDQGYMLQTVRSAAKVAPAKPTMEVLASVRLRAADGRLWVEATDLDVTLIDCIDAVVDYWGAVCVSAKVLGQVLAKMPAGPLSLHFEGERLTVSAEGGPTVAINAEGDDAYPELPAMPDGGLTIDADGLSALLGAVRHAVSTDESRPNLNGVFLRHGDDLRAVATDGHRLAQCSLPAVEGEPFDGCILPGKGVDRLLEHAAGGDLRLAFDVGTLGVALPTGALLFIRLIDAAFPDYRQVIPKALPEPVVIKADELTRALGVVGTLASERTHGVRLDFGAGESGQVEASSDNPDLGKACAHIAHEGDAPTDDGKLTVIACNVAYLLQAVRALDCDTVALHISGGLAPIVLKPAADGALDALHVIMPMRHSPPPPPSQDLRR